jgi:hypothetical protein
MEPESGMPRALNFTQKISSNLRQHLPAEADSVKLFLYSAQELGGRENSNPEGPKPREVLVS